MQNHILLAVWKLSSHHPPRCCREQLALPRVALSYQHLSAVKQSNDQRSYRLAMHCWRGDPNAVTVFQRPAIIVLIIAATVDAAASGSTATLQRTLTDSILCTSDCQLLLQQRGVEHKRDWRTREWRNILTITQYDLLMRNLSILLLPSTLPYTSAPSISVKQLTRTEITNLILIHSFLHSLTLSTGGTGLAQPYNRNTPSQSRTSAGSYRVSCDCCCYRRCCHSCRSV